MKLNIGCGKIYKEGFINIDAYDSTVADKIMPANDLNFHSNSVDRIESLQLIEHLGLFDAIYAFSEWFRVLKPGAELLVETPDLEKSFKKFINGDLETRKNVLTWIYGIESEGMLHKFCFPEELLEDQLKKVGFVDIEKTYIETEKDHPFIRVKCKKIKDYKYFQLFADFRKKLLKEKIADTNNFYLAIEQEKLIDFFILKISKFVKNINNKIIDEIVTEGGIHSVKMTRYLLKECLNHKIVSKDKICKYIEVLDFLIDINFLDILQHLIKESSDVAGTQNKMFHTVCEIGKKSVDKLLTEDKGSDVRTPLIKLSEECKGDKTIFFAKDLLEMKASIYFYQGIKEFILGNYNKAIVKIKECLKLDRNHLLYYWNMGRLLSLTNNMPESKTAYENAINLVRISDFKKKKKLEELLKNEMGKFSSKNYNKPVTGLPNEPI